MAVNRGGEGDWGEGRIDWVPMKESHKLNIVLREMETECIVGDNINSQPIKYEFH